MMLSNQLLLVQQLQYLPSHKEELGWDFYVGLWHEDMRGLVLVIRVDSLTFL